VPRSLRKGSNVADPEWICSLPTHILLFVKLTIYYLTWVETTLAFLVVARYGYIAATETESPRKGKAYLIACLVFSLWICLITLTMIVYNSTRPIYEFDGEIESVHVRDADTRHYWTDLEIHTAAGGDIAIHATDRSDGFRVGQRLKVHYRGDTDELVGAYFYSAGGKQEGVFKSTSAIGQYGLLLVGLFCVWASVRKYRRAPEGEEVQAPLGDT
jgi:hypothetical protein